MSSSYVWGKVRGKASAHVEAYVVGRKGGLMSGWQLQVYPRGLKLLAGTEEVQALPIEDILPSIQWRPGVVIAAACIRDPYALLHFSDGSAILLSVDPEEGIPFSLSQHAATADNTSYTSCRTVDCSQQTTLQVV